MSIPGCNSFFLCKYLKDTMLQVNQGEMKEKWRGNWCIVIFDNVEWCWALLCGTEWSDLRYPLLHSFILSPTHSPCRLFFYSSIPFFSPILSPLPSSSSFLTFSYLSVPVYLLFIPPSLPIHPFFPSLPLTLHPPIYPSLSPTGPHVPLLRHPTRGTIPQVHLRHSGVRQERFCCQTSS